MMFVVLLSQHLLQSELPVQLPKMLLLLFEQQPLLPELLLPLLLLLEQPLVLLRLQLLPLLHPLLPLPPKLLPMPEQQELSLLLFLLLIEPREPLLHPLERQQVQLPLQLLQPEEALLQHQCLTAQMG
jgi:hypothetical protein